MIARTATRVYFNDLRTCSFSDVLVDSITRIKLENSRVKSLVEFFYTKWAILASPLKQGREEITSAMHSNCDSCESILNQYAGTAQTPIGMLYTET